MDCPDDSRIRDIRASYYALITQIDEEIAILIDTLKDCGIYDNTVIIFTADHGELLGDHKAWGKRSFYEGSVAVPLIVHWPDELPSGVVRELPVSVLDLFPTILTMAGVIPGSYIDGVDLLPLARDGIIPDERAGGVASEHGNGRELKLMWRWQEISGREVRQWKYVWLCNGGMEQLFDLTTDPDEAHNRAAQDRDRCRKAHEQLVRWCEVSGFSTAVTNDRQLMNLPFELLPLRGVNDQRSEWVNNDPDWDADC
jgi:arylsulfatase